MKGLESLLLQQIPLDEEIVLKIIKKKSTEWTGVSNMVRKAFEEGRSEAVDLLVNDIYG